MILSNYSIIIGIDPGTHVGFAAYDLINRRFLLIKTMTFWQTINSLKNSIGSRHLIVIEDPRKNKPTFSRDVSNKMMMNISQKVGANKRDAELLIEFCNNNKLDCVPKKPLLRALTKDMNAEKFVKITGYVNSTSQHGRDAAMHVLATVGRL